MAAAADLSKWPGLALKLDLEQKKANEVMAAAVSGVSAWQKWGGLPGEANYYIGEDGAGHIISERWRLLYSGLCAITAQRALPTTLRRWQS